MNKQSLILSFVMVLIVVLALIGVYFYLNRISVKGSITRDVLPQIHDAKLPKRVNEGAIPASMQGNEFNINFWIYVNDYVYRFKEDKIVLNRGSNPMIVLSEGTNNLKVITKPSQTFELDSEEEDLDENICEVKNVPLQRWVNFNVSLNNNVLDIFQDAKLIKTCVVNGYPAPNVGSLDITPDGGFNGFISKVKFTNRGLNLAEMKRIYKQGPGL